MKCSYKNIQCTYLETGGECKSCEHYDNGIRETGATPNLQKFIDYFNILLRILRAKRITLKLDPFYYQVCTQRHPKLKVIPNKKYLVALMGEYHRETYEIRKSIRNGNEYRSFKGSSHVFEMLEINRSNPNRQGKKLPEYMSNEVAYINHFKGKMIHGIFKDNRLIAYADVVKYGEVWVIGPFIGHKDFLKEGIMYHLFDNFALKYPLMYDTFLGNSEGLTKFKKKLGFEEYNVKWEKQ